MFNFGASSSSTPGAPPPTANAGATGTPTFSFTGATPAAVPSQPFNFGGASTSAAPAAPSGSLFGQNQQSNSNPPAGGSGAGGGLFGASSAGGGGLFGAKPTGTPAPGGSLFGGAGSSTGTAPAGGSLFGGAAAGQQQGQAGGLFGGQSTTQPQAQGQTGGGLFGSTSAQPQAGGGLFGSTTSAPNQAGGGLFGGQNAGTPAASGGLFGQSNAVKPTSNLFGQGNTSLGSSNAAQPGALGQSTNNAQGGGGMNKHTKFTELPEGHQKIIEQMDAWIKTQKEPAGRINTEPLGKVIWKTSGEVKAASEEYAALNQGLSSLQTSLISLRDKFVAEEEDLRRIAEIWETFKAADGRPGAVRTTHRDFPQDFFARMAGSMEERVSRYKKTLIQLNRAVAALASDQEPPSAQAVAQTINNHQNALLNLAAQLERLQLRMNDLRGAFARDYQLRTNSMRDPFEIAREEKGLPPVSA